MAAFENKTIKEVRDLLYSGVMIEFNNKIRILPKSFIRILCTVYAGVFIFLYKQIGWVFLQLFPDTAYWGEVKVLGIKIRPLVKWGILIGIGEPENGSPWQGTIKVDVNVSGTPLLSGTQLKSALTGKIYLVDNTKILSAGSDKVDITCAEIGQAGYLSVGDILNFVSPLGNVKREAEVISIIWNGTEPETESEYRFKVVNRWRMQPQGGSLSDYRIWSSEVPDVLNVYPYNDPDSPAGVLLYVSGNPSAFPDRIPSDITLKRVGDACTYDPNRNFKAYRKPLTAVIDPQGDGSYRNIKPVTLVEFDIVIDGVKGISAEEFKHIVRPALEDYFCGREPYIRGLSDDNNRTDQVLRNNAASVVDQIAISRKAIFDSLTMYKNDEITPIYNLGMGELCILKDLTVEEAEEEIDPDV